MGSPSAEQGDARCAGGRATLRGAGSLGVNVDPGRVWNAIGKAATSILPCS